MYLIAIDCCALHKIASSAASTVEGWRRQLVARARLRPDVEWNGESGTGLAGMPLNVAREGGEENSPADPPSLCFAVLSAERWGEEKEGKKWKSLFFLFILGCSAFRRASLEGLFLSLSLCVLSPVFIFTVSFFFCRSCVLFSVFFFNNNPKTLRMRQDWKHIDPVASSVWLSCSPAGLQLRLLLQLVTKIS